ncbi:FAD-dependent oxidoreductase [Streptomyces fagopyri]|uniref:hydroxysqualene dehydroxylase n=1 Tax=Streptomyces fagopyri TaxID=2662397 RepID=UPI003688FD43
MRRHRCGRGRRGSALLGPGAGGSGPGGPPTTARAVPIDLAQPLSLLSFLSEVVSKRLHGLAYIVRTRAGRQKTVAVLGGGVAGLTAAMELNERGYDVTVFEPAGWGGKARSTSLPGTGIGGRLDLPAEHGFRFFPSFYKSLPDTMRRIPYRNLSDGVHGNLCEAPEVMLARSGRVGERTIDVSTETGPRNPAQILRSLGLELGNGKGLSPELLYFANRVMVYMSSSEERRLGQWENMSWWEFTRAAQASEEYRKLCVVGVTRMVVAARAEASSTHTVGGFIEAMVHGFLGQGEAAADRVLNAPTNTAWIDPWTDCLTGRGVRLEFGYRAERLTVRNGQIKGVTLRDSLGRVRQLESDWYVCALPVERVRGLLERGLAQADHRLTTVSDLHTDWMVGIQFYLRERTPIAHGHVIYLDSPWALTSVSQAQFWNVDFRSTYGDGTVADCLSVDISAWDTPGILYGKPARECTRAEVAAEVWAQLSEALDDGSKSVAKSSLVHSWHLDPAVHGLDGPGPAWNEEPLMINTKGSWRLRPQAATGASNLFMAGDYVRCPVNLATMEGANQSGRAAVNALLTAANDPAPPAVVHAPYEPEQLRRLKEVDAQLYSQGRAHVFDTPAPWEKIKDRLPTPRDEVRFEVQRTSAPTPRPYGN